MTEPTTGVTEALRVIARTPSLLVACDYGGTLAPIVDNPSDAHPRRESVAALRRKVTEEHSAIASPDPGFIIEMKPASVAFHYRNARPEAAEKAFGEVWDGPAIRPGVRSKEGKMVIELAVIDTNKSTAVEKLRRQVSADAVIFLGDDVTDEDAFKCLQGPDVGIKIGPGTTATTYRISDTDETA